MNLAINHSGINRITLISLFHIAIWLSFWAKRERMSKDGHLFLAISQPLFGQFQ